MVVRQASCCKKFPVWVSHSHGIAAGLCSCQGYSCGSRCPGRAGCGYGILTVLTLESELLLTLETQSGCFLTSPSQCESTGSLQCPGQRSACLPARQLTYTQPCADRLVTHSLRQLLRLLVCSVFSTAWKDILILSAYRKCGKLSEHLLFINLASYCCIKVINGKTEAQSN